MADRAVRHLERETLFDQIDIGRPDQGIGQRHVAQVEERPEPGFTTGTTRGQHHHTFHGAEPAFHIESSRTLSRSVSMHCQKPSCW